MRQTEEEYLTQRIYHLEQTLKRIGERKERALEQLERYKAQLEHLRQLKSEDETT